MAIPWIKIESTTPTKREIYVIAEALNMDPEKVFAKCVAVWIWADGNLGDGSRPLFVPKMSIDLTTNVRGFADAMILAGWLIETPEGLVFPNAERHLGDGAKKRSQDAKRKDLSRSKPDKTRTKSGPDKIRIEENTIPPVVPLFEPSQAPEPKPTETDPDGHLAQTWLFFAQSARSLTKHDHDCRKTFVELQRLGVSRATIEAELGRKDRNRSEAIWEFQKRLSPREAGSGNRVVGSVARVDVSEEQMRKYEARVHRAPVFHADTITATLAEPAARDTAHSARPP